MYWLHRIEIISCIPTWLKCLLTLSGNLETLDLRTDLRAFSFLMNLSRKILRILQKKLYKNMNNVWSLLYSKHHTLIRYILVDFVVILLVYKRPKNCKKPALSPYLVWNRKNHQWLFLVSLWTNYIRMFLKRQKSIMVQWAANE